MYIILCVTNRLKLCVLNMYICTYKWTRLPQLPLSCFLVMLPVEQSLLTHGCYPTLDVLLMTCSFPCSTSYIHHHTSTSACHM